jgi:hypothetical protein
VKFPCVSVKPTTDSTTLQYRPSVQKSSISFDQSKENSWGTYFCFQSLKLRHVCWSIDERLWIRCWTALLAAWNKHSRSKQVANHLAKIQANSEKLSMKSKKHFVTQQARNDRCVLSSAYSHVRKNNGSA